MGVDYACSRTMADGERVDDSDLRGGRVGARRGCRADGARRAPVEDVMSESLLPAGIAVSFSDIESALAGSNEDARRAAGTALTATVVVAGPRERLSEAAHAIESLKDIGVRAVLISYGDNPAASVRVAGHTVALEG